MRHCVTALKACDALADTTQVTVVLHVSRWRYMRKWQTCVLLLVLQSSAVRQHHSCYVTCHVAGRRCCGYQGEWQGRDLLHPLVKMQ